MRYGDYYFSVPRLTQGVKILIIVNLVVFILQVLFRIVGLGGLLERIFGLTPYLVFHYFYVWQIFSYMFLHSPYLMNIFHIGFNMLALYMFGCELEERWGTKNFIKYYIFSGVMAGAFTALLGIVFGYSYNLVIGAQGAIYALLLAYGLIYPDREILFMFLFPIKMKYFIAILILISLLFLPTREGFLQYTLLGGMGFGYLYIYFKGSFSGRLESFKMRRHQKRIAKRIKLKMKLDKVLDKIAKEGMDSLTLKEKWILKKANKEFRDIDYH